VRTVRILYGAGTISLQAAVHPKCMLGALNMKEEEEEHFQTRRCLLPLLFNFTLEYTIMWVQANQRGLKLNCTHQLLVYAHYIHILVEAYIL